MAFGSRKKGVEKLYVVCAVPTVGNPNRVVTVSKDEARLAKAVGFSLRPPSIFTRKPCKHFKYGDELCLRRSPHFLVF